MSSPDAAADRPRRARRALWVAGAAAAVCAATTVAVVVMWGMVTSSDSAIWTELTGQALTWAGVEHEIGEGESEGISAWVWVSSALLGGLAFVSFCVCCVALIVAAWVWWRNPSQAQRAARERARELSSTGAERSKQLTAAGAERSKQLTAAGAERSKQLAGEGRARFSELSARAAREWRERSENSKRDKRG